MGTLGVVVRLACFSAIALLSYVLIETIVSYADLATRFLGLTPNASTPAYLLLTVASALFVGTLLFAPLALALFGHAGAWIKHVATKSAKFLSLALLFAFGLDVGTAGAEKLAAPGISPTALLVLAGIGTLLLGISSPKTVLGALGGLFDPLQGAVNSAGRDLAAVELEVAPTSHVRGKERPERVRGEAIRFQRLVQALVSLGGRTEIRTSFRDGRGRIFVLARGAHGRQDLEERLLGVVRAHLPEFNAKPCEVPKGPSYPGHSVSVTGVPEAMENPLEPLSRFFLENRYGGDYQFILERARTNLFQRHLSRANQKRLARKAEGQRTTQSSLQGEQQTAPFQDYFEQVRLEEAVKLVERHQSSLAMKCWVRITGLGEDPASAKRVAEGAASVLVGSLSSHRSTSALRTRRAKGDADKLDPKGKYTILLPSEAVPFAWLPQVALGTRVFPSAEFELPPKLEGEIALGTIATNSSPTGHEARIPLDALTKHCFITGMTGSGKTTSCFNLLTQLHQLGVPFLVIEPVKSEYRALIVTIPGIQVFTLGDEETAPFRLNIFEPPPGVKVQTHLENLEAAWNSSFVSYAPLPYVVKEVLAETYKACRWDVRKNVRGRPISFGDFLATAERVTRRLGYEPKVTMDIEAALKTRIRSMTLGGKGPLFDTVSSVPLEDVLRRPTIIELKGVASSEEKAFVAAVLLMNLAEYRETQGNSKELRHLTLIEEAHRLLPNLSTAKGDPEGADPRKRMVEQFADMLAEVRAYGEGLAIVEQIPTKIIPDAIKNTATKVAHRLPAADDREVVSGATNMTKQQAAVLAALTPGEAILSVEKHPLPIRVKVGDVAHRLGMPVGQVLDEQVRQHMAKFYLKNPLPRAPAAPIYDSVVQMVETEWFQARFMEAYKTWLKTGTTEPLAAFLFEAAASFAKTDEETLELESKLLNHAVQFYLPFDDEDRERFPRLFMQVVQRQRRKERA